MRNRVMMAFLIVSLSFAFSATTNADAQETLEEASTQGLSSLFDLKQMQTEMSSMMVSVLDSYLDYLAKPETTQKLAKFQKNYYDALIAQGFTPEQAFELMKGMGNPLQLGSGKQ